MSASDKTPLWTEDPTVLLYSLNLAIDVKNENATWNAITRSAILLLITSILLAKLIGYHGIVILHILFLVQYGPWLYKRLTGTNQPKSKKQTVEIKESFADDTNSVYSSGLPTGFESELPQNSGRAVFTKPSAANPFMNVLLDEIKYNPTRAPAAPVSDPLVNVTFNDFFKVQWTSDPTDVFGRSQSQRQFQTMPSSSIPNDQASYQNWLYLIPGKTCKEGNRAACYPATNGGPVPWLSQPN